ncbi:MAG: hypothetical protein JW763_06385 [candidate division Zixibacteria bacterium]|nr:hypothetical protein [candidate division Zixibacteria bacterium]
MFGSEIVDVIIGLVFVYLLASLICSALNECLARLIALRARVLMSGIRNLLADSSIGETIVAHPLVKGLANRKGLEGKWLKVVFPSYLPSKNFALAMLDTMLEAGKTAKEKDTPKIHPAEGDADKSKQHDDKDTFQKYAEDTFDTLEHWFELIEKQGQDADAVSDEDKKAQVMKSLRTMLTVARTEAKNWDDALAKFRMSIENWYDDAMARVSGWYKRKTQLIVFYLGVVVVCAFNLDSMMIADTLYHDSSAREAIVSMAAQTAEDETLLQSDSTYARVEYFVTALDKLPLPIGWIGSSPEIDDPREFPEFGWPWVYKLLGLLFTVLAVSLGAPFWFDVLNKLMQLRSSGRREVKAEGVTDDAGGIRIAYVPKE